MPEISVQNPDGSRERILIAKDRLSIGRSRDSDIFLPDQWLSRQHAVILRKDDGFYLSDTGSKNGTLLNGTRIQDAQRLHPGDVITLGEHVLTFGLDEPLDEEEPEPAGTEVFSVKELSGIRTKPAIDLEDLRRQNRVLGVLSKAAETLIAHFSLAELFDKVLDLLFESVPAERGAILLLEGPARQPVVKASRSRVGEPIVKVSRSVARRVLEQKVGLMLADTLEHAAFRSQESIVSTGIRSALCAPLWFTSSAADSDEVIGLVYLDTLQHRSRFTQEDLQILTALANVAAAKIENVRLLEESLEKRRLDEDMRLAAEIQRGLLPRGAPSIPGYDLTGSNRPCRTVGGDYFDYAMDQGELVLALGDVSGKGTGAALLMTMLRAAVRAHWGEASPAEAVARINRTVCENVPEGKYVTFFMARLNPASGCLTYVNAGHNPPLLVRAGGSIEVLEEGGMVLGMFESIPYDEGVRDLRPGDVFLVFSDGITETFDEDGNEFGEVGLKPFVAGRRGLGALALEAEILAELERFSGGAKATDDRTLIVLRRG